MIRNEGFLMIKKEKSLLCLLVVFGISTLSFYGHSQNQTQKLTIFYNENYNIVPPRLIKPLLKHAFDGEKYRNVYNALLQDSSVLGKIQFKTPQEMISDQDLLLVHEAQYLHDLKQTKIVATIIELPLLRYVPFITNFLYKTVVTPQKWATSGTVQAALQAVENHACTINLGGGFHHAKPHKGEGFCIFADIPLACKKIWQKYPDKKILVIDLDNHQGNGTALYREISKQYHDNMIIFDIYAGRGYPQDKTERAPWINYNYPVERNIDSAEYIALLKEELKKAVQNNTIDLIIYNAGTDIFQNDPLGSMNVTKEAIIERDLFVFSLAKKENIPLCMVLSGGYSKESAGIIADSIKNIAVMLY